MIVEGVPKFISSFEEDGSFVFDRNGRFIYNLSDTDEGIYIFKIYDIMFNDYV